ncbi:hypothetical protein PV326_004528 [Microctonus aethiopoides]|nr:hypothetical protein PV326_004528 [Microctonus aethiopoides]
MIFKESDKKNVEGKTELSSWGFFRKADKLLKRDLKKLPTTVVWLEEKLPTARGGQQCRSIRLQEQNEQEETNEVGVRKSMRLTPFSLAPKDVGRDSTSGHEEEKGI